MKRLTALICWTAIAASPAAHASFFNNATGLTAPQQTITFESVVVATNQPITTEFQSLGVTFTGAFANPDSASYPNISGNRISNFQSGIGDSPFFSIDFASDQRQVAFALISSPGTTTFRALLDGVQVDTGIAATDATNATNFYGFTGVVFDQVTVSVVSFDRAFIMDNLQTVAAIPEPGSLALLLAGTGLVGVAARRSARSQRRPWPKAVGSTVAALPASAGLRR